MMLLTSVRFLVLKTHGFFQKSYATHVVEVVGLALAVWLGFAVHRHYVPHLTTVQTNEHTTTVTVDKPVLSERTILKIASDPKDREVIRQQLAEIGKLQLTVVQLTDTVAQLQSTGSGPVVQIPPTKPGDPVQYHFQDYRLDFKTDLSMANYSLNQKFVVLTTTGKDKSGKPTTLVSVYEEGPSGQRIPVPAKTTSIVADETAPAWRAHLNLQAGVAFSKDVNNLTSNGGLVGLQWLKRGSTLAPGDTRYAVLTPVFYADQTVRELGLLPISFNLGTLPYQPFTNIWLSPYIGANLAGHAVSRVGLAITATF